MTMAAWLLDLRLQAGHSQTEHPAQHIGHGALPQHGQAGHDRGLQPGPGEAGPESITQVSLNEVGKQDCRKFCTTGIDVAMTIRDFKTLESSIQSLRIMRS